ncbi:hypothetical protein MXD63_09370 [Frankia sp. Cpl3]|nr:hypothetical protein [Parafrankia colletiae]MCK9900282.1 hypothetical protein [Frankia sp. Cpl3]
MDSDSSRQQIHDKGLLPGYTVKWTRATLVLTIAVTGPVQDQSRRTVEEVVAMANRHLIAHQVTNNVTERAAQFTILPATDGANVSPALYPGRGRQRLMIGAISVIVAVGLSIAVDGLVSGRRGRGPKNQEPGEGSNPVRSAGDFPDYGPTSPGYPAAATRDDVQRENNSSAVINEDTMTINTAGRGGPWSGVPGTDRSGRIR